MNTATQNEHSKMQKASLILLLIIGSTLTSARPNEHRNTAGTQQEHVLKISTNPLLLSSYTFEHSEHSKVVEIREIGEKRTIYGWKAVTTRDAR
jgi:hypothetical protein